MWFLLSEVPRIVKSTVKSKRQPKKKKKNPNGARVLMMGTESQKAEKQSDRPLYVYVLSFFFRGIYSSFIIPTQTGKSRRQHILLTPLYEESLAWVMYLKLKIPGGDQNFQTG